MSSGQRGQFADPMSSAAGTRRSGRSPGIRSTRELPEGEDQASHGDESRDAGSGRFDRSSPRSRVSWSAKSARYVRSIFALAVVDRVIPVSPFTGIKAPPLPDSTIDPPDIAEVSHLVAAAYKPLWADLWATDVETGLRSGELRGMRLEHVDFLRRTYRVAEQLVAEPGRGHYLDGLKTSSGLRTLPLAQRTVDRIAARVAAHPPPTDGPWAGLIWTMPDRTPIGESTIDWALKQTCKYAQAGPRHLHELRLHYASVLIAGGENPKVVQKRMGHKDVMTTMRIYAHLFAEAEERTRDVLDAA